MVHVRRSRSIKPRRGFLWILALLLCFAPLNAIPAESPADFDKRITGELAAIDPAAAELFRQAGAARQSGDHRAAASLYAQVHDKVPSFDHAVRRQAYEELQLGNRDKAVTLGRQAVALVASPANESTLALILADSPEGAEPTAERLGEALALTQSAVSVEPDEPFHHRVLCQIALVGNQPQALGSCTRALLRIAPEDGATHYYATLLALGEGRTEDAGRSLEEARRHGLPDDAYRSLRKAIDGSTPWTSRILFPAAKLVGAWAAVFLVLLALGWTLSRMALRAAGRVPAEPTGTARGLDAALRRVYRVVLWLCCAVYYGSVPLVAVAVVAIGGGLVYGIFALGHIPIKIVLLIVVLTFTTLWAIVKSLFFRFRGGDPGLRLDPAKAPGLRAVLDEVARRVGTRAVDNVYLTPGTEIAVMERGGVLRQLAGARERCFILGVGALEGMPLRPFKAILAHEYGHFSNQDTAGGGFALAVRGSLMSMAGMLAAGGAAGWYNPAWLFVQGFYRVFERISQGASRLQEVLADRWAAFLYGSGAFEEGLRHVIARSVRFQAHADATLKQVTRSQIPLANLYAFHPAEGPPEPEIQKAVEAAIHAPASPYDSHPSAIDRFTWVRGLAAAGAPRGDDDDLPAWSLFVDRASIELQQTGIVRENLRRNYGVEIAG